MTRTENLLPAGIPKWIRCYDNGGKTFDRYTVVFTRKKDDGQTMYRGMSEHPCDPQGYGMWGQQSEPLGGLGKRIQFEELPKDCRQLITVDYEYIWGL
jgi:hypothetical protein